MPIIEEKMPEEEWTVQLENLKPVTECLLTTIDNYFTLRTTATRLQKKNNVKYKFVSNKATGELKIWKKKQ